MPTQEQVTLTFAAVCTIGVLGGMAYFSLTFDQPAWDAKIAKEKIQSAKRTGNGIADNLHYMQDGKTGLCFAYKSNGNEFPTDITYVPCTDAVLAQLVNP